MRSVMRLDDLPTSDRIGDRRGLPGGCAGLGVATVVRLGLGDLQRSHPRLSPNASPPWSLKCAGEIEAAPSALSIVRLSADRSPVHPARRGAFFLAASWQWTAEILRSARI